MQEASKKLGITLPRGATTVKAIAAEVIRERGKDFLGKVAKMHFRTAFEVLGLPVPEKKPWTRPGSQT